MPKKPKDQIPKTWKGLIYKLVFYRTKEVFVGIIFLLVIIILGLCLNWGWNENGKFYFNWGKAADIKVEIKK